MAAAAAAASLSLALSCARSDDPIEVAGVDEDSNNAGDDSDSGSDSMLAESSEAGDAGSEFSNVDEGDGGDGDGDDDEFTTPKFDFTIPDAGPGGDGNEACEKIDFVFVIDNSGSMSTHQANLMRSFGLFIQTIAREVEATDYRLIVIDTDEKGADPRDCDRALGSGQVRDCNIPGGLRYMTSATDVAELEATFQCVAAVGVGGDGEEMPISGLIEAISTQSAVGGCNEGFVRDDALMVVTIISDDHPGWAGDDDVNGGGGTPAQWYEDVLEVKGLRERVVVLGLVALLSDQSCIIGPQQADRFVEFVDLFGRQGMLGSVCAEDYDSFFSEAVELIDSSCNDIPPPG